MTNPVCYKRKRPQTRQSLPTNKQKKTKEQALVFVSTYSTMSAHVKRIIRNCWELFRHDPITRSVFQDLPLFSHTRGRNLKDSLVAADIKKRDDQTTFSTPKKGTFPCLCCSQCNSVIKGDTISHPKSGETFKIKGTYT